MKARERHQLKQNEFAATMARLATTFRENRDRATLAVLVGLLVVAAVGGYLWWHRHRNDQAGAMFAVAMIVAQSPIAPAPTVPGAAQAAGTYPTIRARQEAALAAFQRVAAAYPSTDSGVAAAYQMAGTLAALGRLAEAEKAYQDVMTRAGSSLYGPSAHMGYADTLASEGQYDRAIKEYTDLSAQRDGMLPIDGVLMQLARTYVKAGKSADARAAFKRVVDEFPTSSYATEARQQLTQLS
jgi:TolA-binding protein